MTAYLRLPFPSLSCENVIARGSGGQVVAISQRVVLKCPTVFDNPAPPQEAEMKESIERIKNEKQVYGILLQNRHPHIVLSPRCVPQGIFLHRLAMTLQERIEQAPDNPLPHLVQERWIRQLSSALAWLEHLGLVHGDLRPANILLTSGGDKGSIQLGDFDSTVKCGDSLLAASEPFCRLLENYKLPTGSPITEQFALGSCIYTIRFQHVPWHDIDAPTRVRKLMRGEFPDPSNDSLFGEITSQCWLGTYKTVHAVEEEVVHRLQAKRGVQEVKNMLGFINLTLHLSLEAECDEFLRKN